MKPSFIASCIKLAAVGAVFYATYGFANWLTAQRSDIPEIVFSWEHGIPFWAWSIVPYWSLNVFYALGFFLCSDTRQQHRYIAQLMTAQAVVVTCFLLFPLQFSWEKPFTQGLAGGLFASLAAFDQPYNQAPSLHIMLVLIVGRFYWYRLHGYWRLFWALWLGLIALSVLTTWQHHFIDIPTGVLAGALVLWALPWQKNEAMPSPLLQRIIPSVKHYRWAGFYLLVSAAFAALSVLGGAWLFLLWPAAAYLLLAVVYARFGATALQKQASGQHAFAASLLLWPCRLGAYLNMRIWLRKQELSAEVMPGKVHIGSIRALGAFQAALDVCAELPAKSWPENYVSLPMLDMVPPSAVELAQAADHLQNLIDRKNGPVLVCCALGYGRSAAVVLTWLLRHGGFVDLQEAVALLKQVRPKMVLPLEVKAAVLQAIELKNISNYIV